MMADFLQCRKVLIKLKVSQTGEKKMPVNPLDTLRNILIVWYVIQLEISLYLYYSYIFGIFRLLAVKKDMVCWSFVLCP